MAQCQIFYNIALRLISRNLNDEKNKKVVIGFVGTDGEKH